MKTRVKICGLKEAEHIRVAADAGAAYIGFNFFPKSPRFVSYDQARALSLATPVGVAKVGLTVNFDNTSLDELVTKVPLDMIQLHGTESPERVEEVRRLYGLPVVKAFGIATEADTKQIDIYGEVADQLLVDAKPPKDAKMLGGNGMTFDWTLVKRKFWPKPWMLAGGLTIENVAQAIQTTGAKQVDLSSGVESAPGVKDPDLIRAFIKAAQEEPAPKLS